MRQLKFHERKLLKKVDFLQWKSENNHRELEVCPVDRICICSVLKKTRVDRCVCFADHAKVSHTGSR